MTDPVDDMPAQHNRIEIRVDQFNVQIEQLSEQLTLLLIGRNALASLRLHQQLALLMISA